MKKKWLLLSAIIILLLCVAFDASAATDGWKKEGSYLCYYSNGERVTGTQTINGDIYYFTDDGYLQGNGHVQNARYYGIVYLDENNQIVTGWQTIDGATYYFFPDTGKAAAYSYTSDGPSVLIDGTRYAFDYNGKQLFDSWYMNLYGDSEGKILSGYQTIGGYKYLFSDTGKAQSGFHEINGETHFFDDGLGVKQKEVYGWKLISGSLYYFDLQTGVMQTSSRTIDDTLYVFSDLGVLQHNGPIILKYESNIQLYGFSENNERLTGLSTIDGSLYYFDSMYYFAYKGLTKVGDDYYFFNLNNGAACTNQIVKSQMFPGSSVEYAYYYDTDGKRAFGWQTINGDRYYFGEKGAYYGYKSIDDNDYYFDEQGKMLTDCLVWFEYWDKERLIYVDADGKPVTGWKEYEGSVYYFTPFAYFGDEYIDGAHYFFDAEGKMQKNTFEWIKQNSESEEKYLFYYGEDGKRLSGWQVIDGSRYYFGYSGACIGYCYVDDGHTYYYFDEKGKMQFNCLQKVIDQSDNNTKLYYFGSDGKRITGWKEIAGKMFYFNPEAYTDAWGIDNEYYYFNSNGEMQTNLLRKTRVHQWDETEGLYYYGQDGKRVSGWQTINGSKYYFDYSGAYYGLQNPGGGPYYFNDNGIMQTNLLIKINDGETDHVYYFGTDGKQVSGWHTINGAKYYFWSEGAYIGHQVVDGVGYYFDADGKMQTNSILNEEFNGTVYTYYFGSDGKQVNDWVTIDGSTYYFFPDKYTNAWEINGEYYYFDDQGRMQKNLLKKTRRSQWDETENLYYYGPEGKRVSGWQTINGSQYYFDNYTYIAQTGTMIDGDITYTFSDDGKLVHKEVPANRVSLDVTYIVLDEGNTRKLTATVSPSDAVNKNVIWHSDDEAVAKVDAEGIVTAIAEGHTNINVTTENGKYSAFCHVQVNKTDKVEAFVTRCYSIILGREPDAGGMKTWYNELVSGRKAASEIIDNFVRSQEFLGKHYSNADAVEILYKAMLGRGSDPAGKADWVGKLDAGYPFAVVINGFCGSKEFKEICDSYGIAPGSVSMEQGSASDQQIRAFVTRCYKIILGRDADEVGMNTWFNELKSRRRTAAEIIEQFVYSQEFQNKKYSNPDAVEILYKAMLGRGSDPAGKADWVGRLNNGQPLTAIINGFCGSMEFTAICEAYGITPGSVKVETVSKAAEEVPEETVQKPERKANLIEITNASDTVNENLGTAVQAIYINEEKAKEFIGRCYQAILGREAGAEELNGWIGQMMNGSKTADQIARGFLFSGEFKGRNIGNEELVKILYRVYMNREADAEGLATWTQKLDEGTSLNDLLNVFAKTGEFKGVLKDMAE